MVIGGVFWKILQDCFLYVFSEKVDKEWYEVILRENISSIKHKLVTGDIPIGENILNICEIMKSAAITSSSNKAIFKAKPKLNAFLPSFSLVSVGFQLLMVFHLYLSKFYILILSLRLLF
jgi:hypothetical protein